MRLKITKKKKLRLMELRGFSKAGKKIDSVKEDDLIVSGARGEVVRKEFKVG